jgi:DNA-directed RNA polymerase beta' subunit
MNTTKEVYSITFGIMSNDEILKNSVCCVSNTKKSGPNSIYDPRMGTSLSTGLCETCNQTPNICTGHFGHIELSSPIIHPLYYRIVEKILNCVCFKCHKLLLTQAQLELDGITKLKGLKRFDSIFETIKKVNMCCRDECNTEKPKLKFSQTDNTYSIYHDTKKVKENHIILSTNDIKTILTNISEEDVKLLGFKPSESHPRNYILDTLPVMPPVDRPFVQVNGNIWDDDITIQYIEILKMNEQLKQLSESGVDENDPRRVKAITNLIFRVSTMFNNSQNKARHTTNGRPIKGIKERLAGKDGQIRNNMMGKRADQTARTVIGPDPTLKSDEIAVPPQIAATLTAPEYVTSMNIEQLQNLVNSGVIETIIKDMDKKTCVNIKRYRLGTRILAGDVIHRGSQKIKVTDPSSEVCMIGDKIERGGKTITEIIPTNREYKLQYGMIVNRPLKDGDILLLNRQPTLHKGSMMAMKVKIREGKTIRMNLAVCKSFNADFDGDEMNLHAAQGIEALTELRMLSAAKFNIISAQSSKPNVAIVQDSLLGAYRMTKGIVPINKGKFFDISMHLELKVPIMDRIQQIRRVLKNKGKKVQCFNGKGVISLFLPSDLEYEHKNNADQDEPVVKIHKGVLYEGTLDKSVLGSSFISLITLLNKEYGPDEAMYFIDCIHFCTSQWLMNFGFTVGLGDCLVNDPDKEREVQENIRRCYIEADGIKSTTTHSGVREMRVNGALNKAKDIGLKIAKDSLDKQNNFISTVTSGSKGDFFNIAQITGLLGQQNLKGARVPLSMNGGRRSLPHYPFENLTPEMEYESRGFIASSFIRGLNPREFYFHAMSGREGITDTAMGTATSGYMQRRIVKLTEDILCQYDGTVRDASGKIYQMSYGGDGFDPTMTTRVKGQQEACNVTRLVDRLNQKHL